MRNYISILRPPLFIKNKKFYVYIERELSEKFQLENNWVIAKNISEEYQLFHCIGWQYWVPGEYFIAAFPKAFRRFFILPKKVRCVICKKAAPDNV